MQLNEAGSTKTLGKNIHYLLLNVIQRIWRIHSETDQDDVGIGVRQWAQTIVILLTYHAQIFSVRKK